ncbi:hypothetical protein ElyMa_003860400 [Elysia marginata]|uniref:Uncharacterized protein n=1 Tax=Elysia marginata TaxID=1093978 RepID=A0AAV4FJH4_9GAST|nr:hypothetical protein ElyMa_003860400 [Elysia marginata]
MLEVKPTPSMLMGHHVVADSSSNVVDGIMVTNGGLDQVEVLNRLNGNYGFSHVRAGMETPSTSSIGLNNRRNNSHQLNAGEEHSISAMRTWPSSPSSASSPSSSLSSLSSSSSSSTVSSSSLLSSSEIEIDKENKEGRNLSYRDANPSKAMSPCALEAAVREFGSSLRMSRNITTNKNVRFSKNSDIYPSSNSYRRDSPSSDLPYAFSRSLCGEDTKGSSLSRDRDRTPFRRCDSDATSCRPLSSNSNAKSNYISNKTSPTMSHVFDSARKYVPSCTDSGQISPTSQAIADALSERRACHDFAKYLISPSSASASPSSRSPGTPSSQISSTGPSSPAAGVLYRGVPLSRSANALTTRTTETLSSNNTSCSSSPTVTDRLLSLKNNPHHFPHQLRRQQQRDRKFRLNLFMYSALYRKQRRTDTGYIIYHNPIEDGTPNKEMCPGRISMAAIPSFSSIASAGDETVFHALARRMGH